MSRLCRFCRMPLDTVFADLGMTPLSNSFLSKDQLAKTELFYPLQARVCSSCFLVQLEEFETPQRIFSDYPYFSSYSESWLEHCRAYADVAIQRFGLKRESLVIEVASNDGYLLQFFRRRGIGVLGVEPASNVAAEATAKGIPTLVRFLSAASADEIGRSQGKADLVIGNNVFAHVPDLNDFARGLAALLKPDGVLTLEFPHLLRLIQYNQFDTIYHEHFSYFSLLAAQQVLNAHDLHIFDVEELLTHGGSLRVYAQPKPGTRQKTAAPERILDTERAAGLNRLDAYRGFSEQVKASKRMLLRFLIDARDGGKRVAGYGAPAKGNTLLNYCGVRSDLLEFTVDRNPHKQGMFLPGTHIPVHAPERILEKKPDYVLILPWNLRDEIVHQMNAVRTWGGRFVVPIPRVEVLG